jgi:hypothetical protein
MSKPKARKLRLCRSQRRVSEAPVLTLEGLWLQESGFNIGDLVRVERGKGELTIKVIEKWK